MASLNTLRLRAEQADLVVTPWRLNRPPTPRQMAPGEYAALLRESGRISGDQRRRESTALREQQDKARGFQRAIPTSGPGRRRAKANRNKRAVERTLAERESLRATVVPGDHFNALQADLDAPPQGNERVRRAAQTLGGFTRGRQYEGDQMPDHDDAFATLTQPAASSDWRALNEAAD